jgi:hypothetical protein
MAADTQNHRFPPAIAKAVVQVMRSIGTLGKDQENKFDHYDYASIDDFIAHVRGHCAEAGLAIIPDEARDAETNEVSKKDGKPMVIWNARFGFILIHETGECYGPVYKSVAVQFNGAQAAGSAQSYALKQLMRFSRERFKRIIDQAPAGYVAEVASRSGRSTRTTSFGRC